MTGYNGAHAPSNEEFQSLREHIAQLDDKKREYEAEMEKSLEWLAQIIAFNPNRVRELLGFDPLPATRPGACTYCGLWPCGCERRRDGG